MMNEFLCYKRVFEPPLVGTVLILIMLATVKINSFKICDLFQSKIYFIRKSGTVSFRYREF